MSSIRLFILGTLAASGPLHGHQIRQQAQSDRTDMWADVPVGSLYGALGRMAGEGIAGGQCHRRGGHDLRRARLSRTSERPGPHRADTDRRVGTRAG